MRKHIWVTAALIILVLSLCGWYLYQDINESRKLPQDVESQTEFRTVLTETYQLRYSIPPAALILLPIIVWILAITRRVILSWLRTLLAVVITVTLLFTGFTNLFASRMQAENASYYPLFNTVLSLLVWVIVSTLLSLALWFAIERIYVRRIASNA